MCMIIFTFNFKIGKKAELSLPLQEDQITKYDEYMNLIQKGKEAEERIITYVDTIVTAMNPKQTDLNIINPVVPDPHPCCIDICLIDPDDYDEDYLELVNCVQRHVCRTSGYCKNKKKDYKILNHKFLFPF